LPVISTRPSSSRVAVWPYRPDFIDEADAKTPDLKSYVSQVERVFPSYVLPPVISTLPFLRSVATEFERYDLISPVNEKVRLEGS